MGPMDGDVGVNGCALITTGADTSEVHPEALVTKKIYVPGNRSDTVVLVPVPEQVISPGSCVNVQVPFAGKLSRNTLPVSTVHVGWVTVPIDGDAGVIGCTLITTGADSSEVHPETLVTAKVYVLGANSDMVVLVPIPE